MPAVKPHNQRTMLAILIAVMVLLCAGGVLMPLLFGKKESEEPAASPSATASAEAVSASPVSDGGGEPGDGAETPVAPLANQDESAREALEAVVPVWATYDSGAWGTDVSAWTATWADDPHVDPTFLDLSERRSTELWSVLVSSGVNANGATLADVQLSWKQENVSAWNVTIQRNLVSADGSGSISMVETTSWEFTVEQQEDGSSRLTGFVMADVGDE